MTETLDRVDLKNMSPGSQIDVETKSRHYHIECLGGNSMKISGHPEYCPTPVVAELQGSTTPNGTFESGAIKPGNHLVFLLGKNLPVTTSKILRIHVNTPDQASVAIH
jgi:hypothetical protein